MGNTLSPTVFYEACQRGDIHLVEKVLSGISPQLKQSLFAHRVEEMPMTSTPLFTAIQNHHVEIVELLLKHGMDPNARLKSFVGSETALMHAIRWRDAAIVDVLLRYRADCEEIDTTGKTALHKACILRESSLKNTSTALEIVQVLLKHKADLSAIDKNGNVPLHSACLSGNLALVQYFLTEHADTVLKQLDFPNKMAKTPLMLACEFNFAPIVSALLQAGANPFLALSERVVSSRRMEAGSPSSKAKRPHKKTALCWAVENGHEGIVELLLSHHRDMLDASTCGEQSVATQRKEKESAVSAASETVRVSSLRSRHAAPPQSVGDAAGTDIQSQVSSSSSSSSSIAPSSSSSSCSAKKAPYRLGGWMSPKIPFTRTSAAIPAQEIEFQERQRLVSDDNHAGNVDADDDLSDREDSDSEEEEDMSSSVVHSITHLVGCCLLEAILLGHVTIAHLLLEHVHFYYQLQQQLQPESDGKGHQQWVQQALSKMYYRALVLSCQRRNRLMVRMMLAHLQAVHLPVRQLVEQHQRALHDTNDEAVVDNWQYLFGKHSRDETIVAMLQEQCQ